MSPRASRRALAAVCALACALLPAAARADLGDQVTAALHSGSAWAFALVFVGGVLTSLTPCVYPLIPITLSIFGAKGDNVSRGRALSLAAAYVLGIGLMYSALGVGVALTGKQFGTFMASPWVIVPIAVLFLAMAASMFGAFELNLPVGLQTRLSRLGGSGYSGALVMGLVGGIIAAPCTGPVLAALLAYVATTRSVVFGGGLLFVYALGMGTLFFVLAAGARSLPRSGAWMEAVKSIFGVVMIVAAAYFLRNVLPPLRHYGDWRARFGLVHGAIALFGVLMGGIHLTFHDGAVSGVRKAFGVALVCFGLFGVVAWTLTARPLDWIHGETETLARAKAERKPVLFDFNADWCIPCKALEAQVFDDDGVRGELSRFVVGKIDCTKDDEAVDAVKARYGAAELPTVVLLDSDGKLVQRWGAHDLRSPAQLVDRARQVR